ncbi:protein PPP1R35 homolog [Eurosta solidaginis]|uniref:protein PPP1R35 homolog n=1 Tax=Eurosta solidaginis TaxID=178769 RepID=UPI0035308F2B
MSSCGRKSVKINGSKPKSPCRNRLLTSSHISKAKSQEEAKSTKSLTAAGAIGNFMYKNVGNDPQMRKYHTAEMNTILREVNQIKQVEALQLPLFRREIELTPRSKAAIAPKVTQRLNFNADQVLFKNLTPLNVNDSILIQKPSNANPNKFKKINKVPAPELCHWLEPQTALKFTIPEPELMLEFCDTEVDPFDCYLLMENL